MHLRANIDRDRARQTVIARICVAAAHLITLTVQASSVAELNWQTSGSYDFYLVYRNGNPIAKLTQTQYTDELSSGSTTYQDAWL